MNNRLSTLTKLLQLKEEDTRKAHHALQAAKEEFDQNKLRHDQLVGYRQDYVQQLQVLGNEGSNVGRLRNRIDFINHLDTALVQLNSQLSLLARLRAKAEVQYKEAKAAEEGVVKLMERVNKTEQIKQQRAEQKESDEYAQKQWYSKNIND